MVVTAQAAVRTVDPEPTTEGRVRRSAHVEQASTRRGQAQTAAQGAPALGLRLMSGFTLLRDGAPVEVQPRGQRVLALLALRDQPLARSHVAATLWFDSDEERALANLRSTLWRLNQGRQVVVAGRAGHLELHEDVRVDVLQMVAQARRLTEEDGPVGADDDVAPLRGELLPGWWDDWVVTEREWLRQLQLHALERLARRLGDAGRYTKALEAGLAAVAAEPLRESAHRTVVALHLAEGNRSEALRQYHAYERLLHIELAVAPSEQMRRALDLGRV